MSNTDAILFEKSLENKLIWLLELAFNKPKLVEMCDSASRDDTHGIKAKDAAIQHDLWSAEIELIKKCDLVILLKYLLVHGFSMECIYSQAGMSEAAKTDPIKDDEGCLSSCSECMADLTITSSVTREYINQDNDESGENAGDDITSSGHYENGEFITDTFEGFGGGNFELRDDSDLCASCDGNL